MLAMQMLGRGNQHGVDALVFQQMAVVKIRFGVGRKFARFFQASGVDVGRAYDFGIGTAKRETHQLLSSRSRANDAEANPFVGAQHPRRGERCGRNSGGEAFYEIPA